MVSLIDGLDPMVLRENPKPGRTVGSERFGALGLFGSFSSSLLAVGSKVSISLKKIC